MTTAVATKSRAPVRQLCQQPGGCTEPSYRNGRKKSSLCQAHMEERAAATLAAKGELIAQEHDARASGPTEEMTPAKAKAMDDDRIVRKGAASFIAVGQALARIRDGKGYKLLGFPTFDAYCTDAGFTPRTGYNYLKSAGFANPLSQTRAIAGKAGATAKAAKIATSTVELEARTRVAAVEVELSQEQGVLDIGDLHQLLLGWAKIIHEYADPAKRDHGLWDAEAVLQAILELEGDLLALAASLGLTWYGTGEVAEMVADNAERSLHDMDGGDEDVFTAEGSAMLAGAVQAVS